MNNTEPQENLPNSLKEGFAELTKAISKRNEILDKRFEFLNDKLYDLYEVVAKHFPEDFTYLGEDSENETN